MAGLQFARFHSTRVLCLALVAVFGSTVLGQYPRRNSLEVRPQETVVESLETPGNELLTEGEAPARARYDEPPLPPYDYWNPTWMPCQSLRTNRSLVLGHLWFGMDIMGWSTKGVHAPPLVTTGPAAAAQADAGVLGQSGTRVLFGDEFFHNEMRAGGKISFGWWFDPNQYRGVEFHYFELDGEDIEFQADAPLGGFILARPIIDAAAGTEASVLVSFPGIQTGSIFAASNLQLTSTGILFRDLFWASPTARIDYLVGYRHAHLFDNLTVIESLGSLDDASGFPSGESVGRVDNFRAINQFDGADLGLRGWWSRNGKLALTGLAKIAIGAANKNVIIEGATATSSSTTSGGVLALPSNIGRRAEQEFGVVSEIGIGLEWQPACLFKFSLGYTWLYWSDVARALDQVDRTVATDQLAPTLGGGGRPAFNLHTTSFWAQGLSAGFTYQF